jgi:hypothetical protein
MGGQHEGEVGLMIEVGSGGDGCQPWVMVALKNGMDAIPVLNILSLCSIWVIVPRGFGGAAEPQGSFGVGVMVVTSTSR